MVIYFVTVLEKHGNIFFQKKRINRRKQPISTLISCFLKSYFHFLIPKFFIEYSKCQGWWNIATVLEKHGNICFHTKRKQKKTALFDSNFLFLKFPEIHYLQKIVNRWRISEKNLIEVNKIYLVNNYLQHNTISPEINKNRT